MAPTQAHDLTESNPHGPHPSHIQIAKPYVFEQAVQECIGNSEGKDDGIRLQGVAWIDSVRKAMHLPVRTYNTAVVYYLKYRLAHPDNNGFIDAAAAALFAACKIEDTLKKSKEILCAAYNLKLTPAEQLPADAALFENHSKTIIGLERLMLEASGFDFRNRYPQRLVLKIAKYFHADKETVGKTAYNMSLDLYRTYAPLKQTTATLAVACVELSGRIFEQKILELEIGKGYRKWRITRAEVMETLLDLLDLYTHHRVTTIVGQDHVLDTFIGIRIVLNQEASANKYPRHTQTSKKKHSSNGVKAASSNGARDYKEGASKSVVSPRDDTPKELRSPQSAASANGLMKQLGVREGTVRFMLDPERARDEKQTVAEFFRVEEEEIEVEVERGVERRRDSSEGRSHRPRAQSNYEPQMGVRGGRIMVGGDFERRVAKASKRLTEEELWERARDDSDSWSESESGRRTGVEYLKSAAKRRAREPLDDQRLAYHTFRGIVPSGPKREVLESQAQNQSRRKKRKSQRQRQGGHLRE